ncbi:MAG TPA: hypothetical protein VNV43_03685 [Candidatus Acidoferrales bacterium]|jgi:hypothetical protein|nr:hypothetical protein [Candidatus Acidoferrales bacterium]
MDIQGRLRIFFERLKAAPPASSADEAIALVCRLIEEVEDEFCPLPRESPPPNLRFTGRMYAPQSDRIFRLDDGSILAETRRHLIFCGRNGDIQIENADEESIVLTKAGK